MAPKFEHYIGVKEILATPMARGDYCEYRGWQCPEGEDPTDEGYLVEYLGSPNPNHKDHVGYISWSPKTIFEKAYTLVEGMDLGLAIRAAKEGKKIARKGWGGTGMFVVYMEPLYLSAEKVNERTSKFIGEGAPLDCQGYFAMHTANKTWQPGWLASQSDMLSEDWYVVG